MGNPLTKQALEILEVEKGATKKGPSETAVGKPLTNKELELMNAYWRACNYLSVGMIYLRDNPLLKEPL